MNIDTAETRIKTTLDRIKQVRDFNSARDEGEQDVWTPDRKSVAWGICQSTGARIYAFAAYNLPRPVPVPFIGQALDVFLADTVVPASGCSTFNGHFSSLVSMVESSSRLEALPLALEAVALASLGKRIHSPEIQLEAARRYTNSIRHFRTTDLNFKSNSLRVVACIVLLSTYEACLIINSDSSSNLNWLKHVHGLFAAIKHFVQHHQLPSIGVTKLILGSWPSPDITEFSTTPSCRPENIILKPEIPQFGNLCAILPKVQSLFKRSAAMLEPGSVRYESVLQRYKDEALALRSELLAWSSVQPEIHRAKTIQHFTQAYILRFPAAEDFVCPVTRADVYRNYFIACMWSSYRQCQLHLTDLLSRISRALYKNPDAYNQSREYANLCNETQTTVNDVCASIPFLLVGEKLHGNKPDGPIWHQNRPPMLLGGLSLQWNLFTISILDIVGPILRDQMKISLLWIGKNLGIGQATVMAHMDKNLPGGITARGDALRWTGFLI